MRFGLERMHRLMTALGMPQRRFASIHVVGSNGKSSTVRFIAAILERHGLRTGSYTSPHLASFRERIEVGEEPVSEERFAAAVRARPVGHWCEDVTQFEALTAAAYHELAAREVEVAVIEAGLGGRYDATNVIPSKLPVLTGVGLEHTRWLGPDDRATSPRRSWPWCATTARWSCPPTWTRRRSRWPSGWPPSATPRLVTRRPLPDGPFQRAELRARPRRRRGVPRAARRTPRRWTPPPRDARPRPARRGRRSPLTIHDGAHNPAGAQALAEALPELVGERRPSVLVASVLDDKDAAGMLGALLPAVRPRGLHALREPARAVAGHARVAGRRSSAGLRSETVAEPHAAVERAREIAGPDGAVVATGSIYLIADLVRDEGRAGRRACSASARVEGSPSMDRGDGPSFGAMIGLVAFVVAT